MSPRPARPMYGPPSVPQLAAPKCGHREPKKVIALSVPLPHWAVRAWRGAGVPTAPQPRVWLTVKTSWVNQRKVKAPTTRPGCVHTNSRSPSAAPNLSRKDAEM